MMDFLEWIFDLLTPFASFIVYTTIVVCLVAIAFIVSFVLAKIEAKSTAKDE